MTGVQTCALPISFAELREFLRVNGLYVFTINGFPYGPFHGTRVKEDVYLPDWQDEERLRYTNLLADLLAALLPAGVDGSVSTVPGAFRARVQGRDTVARMASLMIRHAAHLVRLREETGHTIALALEPEPCCFLETIDETVGFFESWLFSAQAGQQLAAETGLQGDAAEEALRRHLGVCLDLCHAAVEFEDRRAIASRLHDAGIRIAKMQLSAGLQVPAVTPQAAARLRAFADDVYLHQVVEANGAGFKRYVDLPEALAQLGDNGKREWRIHFHVPVFLEDLGDFLSTQSFLRDVLHQHHARPISPHLEIETYTWDVLPEPYRSEDVVSAVVRELDWVVSELSTPKP